MKVLLTEDIKKLGYLGDVVEVPDGYARNYLIPCGLAQPPDEANLRAIAQQRANRAQQRTEDRNRLEAAAAAVNGAEAVVAAKANETGHLFGSVTKAHIAANLREQGFEVPDDVVQLVENIKEIGSTQVSLEFADGITAGVTVTVVPLQEKTGDEQ